jgi:hypothetical protein
MEKRKLTNWLIKKKKLSSRSAADVYCRYNRVTAMIKISTNDHLDKSLSKLNKCPEHISLTRTVRSQLRRSVTLVYEFLDSK